MSCLVTSVKGATNQHTITNMTTAPTKVKTLNPSETYAPFLARSEMRSTDSFSPRRIRPVIRPPLSDLPGTTSPVTSHTLALIGPGRPLHYLACQRPSKTKRCRCFTRREFFDSGMALPQCTESRATHLDQGVNPAISNF